MVFLALLAIAIGVLLVFFLVLVGLVEAPWPLLLLGLLFALYGLQRVVAEGQPVSLTEIELQNRADLAAQEKAGSAETSPSKEEVLTYRGIRYRVAKPAEPDEPSHESETLVEGIYRGQHWQRWRTTSAETPEASADNSEITYRGHKVIKPDQEA
jgi:hypothetical protein